MIRSILAAGVGVLGLAQPALADRVIFVGSLVYTSAQNCEEDRTGSRFSARFHPNNAGDNPNISALSQFDLTGAENYRADGRFKAQLSPVVITLIYNFGDRLEGVSRLKITESNPPLSQITETTDFVTLVGQIESPGADPGVGGDKCRSNFRAGFTRRIE